MHTLRNPQAVSLAYADAVALVTAAQRHNGTAVEPTGIGPANLGLPQRVLDGPLAPVTPCLAQGALMPVVAVRCEGAGERRGFTRCV